MGFNSGFKGLKRRGRQFSRLLSAEVRALAVVMLETPTSEVMWSVLATHSIRQFPLDFPSLASPCAITFQLDSTTEAACIFYLQLVSENLFHFENSARYHHKCAGHSIRAVQGVGLRPLACWDRGFESHRGHEYLSVVSVACCQVEVSATSWSLVQRSPTDCCVSWCVI